MGKINVQREVVRRNVVNCRIKKKDTGEASFIYKKATKMKDPFKYYASHYRPT